jgi:hypothetical protein
MADHREDGEIGNAARRPAYDARNRVQETDARSALRRRPERGALLDALLPAGAEGVPVRQVIKGDQRELPDNATPPLSWTGTQLTRSRCEIFQTGYAGSIPVARGREMQVSTQPDDELGGQD